ncbi:hypothetical protein JCM33374_g3920 [Metschnikowia sp. JCM 33374]|nr:hypothetical protein JCM33374_g3920 [Metschnikowia sp. JCM 33374]
MTENYWQSYKRQKIIGQEVLSYAPNIAFNLPTIERDTFPPVILTSWVPSYLNSPQSFHYNYQPQGRTWPSEYHENKALNYTDGESSPVTDCISHVSNAHSGSRLTENSEKYSLGYVLNDSVGINSTQSSEIYEKTPQTSPSMVPSDEKIPNYLNKLPEQTSQASVEKPTQSPLDSFPLQAFVEDQSRKIPPTRSKHSHLPYGPNSQNVTFSEQKEGLLTAPPMCKPPGPSKPNASLDDGKLSPEVVETFEKLESLLNGITSSDCCGLLVEVLRRLDHQYISLDEFYNLLYNTNALETVQNATMSHVTPYNNNMLKLKALKVLYLVLITFECSKAPIGPLEEVSMNSLRISPNKFHRLLSKFLAIKIVFTIVKKGQYPQALRACSRDSIYKVYYILCQEFIEKYPAISSYPGFSESLILGKVILGKIMKFVYPNTKTKRLGKRGESKVHYVGLTFNYSEFNSDMLFMLELEIPQIKALFAEKRRKNNEEMQKCCPGKEHSLLRQDLFNTIPNGSFQHDMLHSQNPSHSYVNPWEIRPDFDPHFRLSEGKTPTSSYNSVPFLGVRENAGPKYIWRHLNPGSTASNPKNK